MILIGSQWCGCLGETVRAVISSCHNVKRRLHNFYIYVFGKKVSILITVAELNISTFLAEIFSHFFSEIKTERSL